jgi:hypothetical protein
MKAGLPVSVCIIFVRIILEQLGAPGSVDNVFGVAWLLSSGSALS